MLTAGLSVLAALLVRQNRETGRLGAVAVGVIWS